MAHTMRRDPFARGAYERVCHGQGECAWCGQKRPRVYSYVWVSDDDNASRSWKHRAAKLFCTFGCFSVFYS
jgi:hypothetical protein